MSEKLSSDARPKLPNEIITNIISLIPEPIDSKTLCTLERVCKHTRKLITELHWRDALFEKYPESKPYVTKDFKEMYSKITEYAYTMCDPVQLRNGIVQVGTIQHVKIALVGAEFTGKSALFNQRKHFRFDVDYHATIENFFSATLHNQTR